MRVFVGVAGSLGSGLLGTAEASVPEVPDWVSALARREAAAVRFEIRIGSDARPDAFTLATAAAGDGREISFMTVGFGGIRHDYRARLLSMEPIHGRPNTYYLETQLNAEPEAVAAS